MRRRQFLVDAGLTLALASFGIVKRTAASAGQVGISAGPVGVRVGFGKGWSEPSVGWRVTRLTHTMPVAASDIQLVYANVTRSEKEFEAAGRNPIVIAAAIEFPEGMLHSATFAGRPDLTVMGGDTVVSEPVQISIPAGANISRGLPCGPMRLPTCARSAGGPVRNAAIG
jgi:hypothetical protein